MPTPDVGPQQSREEVDQPRTPIRQHRADAQWNLDRQMAPRDDELDVVIPRTAPNLAFSGDGNKTSNNTAVRQVWSNTALPGRLRVSMAVPKAGASLDGDKTKKTAKLTSMEDMLRDTQQKLEEIGTENGGSKQEIAALKVQNDKITSMLETIVVRGGNKSSE